jgi:hypothetical protein
MLNSPTPERASPLRNFFIVTGVVLLIGGLYVGWVFYSRWEASQALNEKAAEKTRAQASETFEAMGGNRFEILGYSANPAVVRAGERSSLCYSVSNAKSVEIEPQPDEPVWPAFARCVNVTPRKTTTYTLTIGDGGGNTKTAVVEVKVR